MGYTVLITQSGQTVADIALQAYGTASVTAMNAIVTDNPAVFPDGISSLVPAGVPVKVRTDAPFANRQVQGYFGGQELNSTYSSGQGGVFTPPGEDVILDPPGLLQIVVGQRDNWRMDIHLAWKEDDLIFGGDVVVLADTERAEAAINYDAMDYAEHDPRLGYEIAARYEGDNIILMLNTENVSALKYKIISAI